MSLQITSERFAEAFAKMELFCRIPERAAMCANPLWIQAALSANELCWSHSRNPPPPENQKINWRWNSSADDGSVFSEGDVTLWSWPAMQASFSTLFLQACPLNIQTWEKPPETAKTDSYPVLYPWAFELTGQVQFSCQRKSSNQRSPFTLPPPRGSPNLYFEFGRIDHQNTSVCSSGGSGSRVFCSLGLSERERPG